MKSLILLVTIISAMTAIAVAEKWTHQVEQGEDATSTHYYFGHSAGQSVSLVRWVWNGGAQNKPRVIDYRITTGKITVRHYVGERKSIPDLVAGRNAELTLTLAHSVSAKDVERLFLSATFKEPLTKRQKTDLKNLKDIIAELGLRKTKKAEPKKTGPVTSPGG